MTLIGKVVDAITGAPVTDFAAGKSAQTDDQGKFEFDIRNGETVEREDLLYHAGGLRWEVKTSDGMPVTNAASRISPVSADSPEIPRQGNTDSIGLWIQWGLYPGDYVVETTTEDGRLARDTVTIRENHVTEARGIAQ